MSTQKQITTKKKKKVERKVPHQQQHCEFTMRGSLLPSFFPSLYHSPKFHILIHPLRSWSRPLPNPCQSHMPTQTRITSKNGKKKTSARSKRLHLDAVTLLHSSFSTPLPSLTTSHSPSSPQKLVKTPAEP